MPTATWACDVAASGTIKSKASRARRNLFILNPPCAAPRSLRDPGPGGRPPSQHLAGGLFSSSGIHLLEQPLLAISCGPGSRIAEQESHPFALAARDFLVGRPQSSGALPSRSLPAAQKNDPSGWEGPLFRTVSYLIYLRKWSPSRPRSSRS